MLPGLEARDQKIPIQGPILNISGQELMGAVFQNIPQTFTIACNTEEVPETAVVVKPDCKDLLQCLNQHEHMIFI